MHLKNASGDLTKTLGLLVLQNNNIFRTLTTVASFQTIRSVTSCRFAPGRTSLLFQLSRFIAVTLEVQKPRVYSTAIRQPTGMMSNALGRSAFWRHIGVRLRGTPVSSLRHRQPGGGFRKETTYWIHLYYSVSRLMTVTRLRDIVLHKLIGFPLPMVHIVSGLLWRRMRWWSQIYVPPWRLQTIVIYRRDQRKDSVFY